jgi:hypothetical protein
MKRGPKPLPEEARQSLAPFFPDLDLSKIMVYEGIPWYVVGEPRGYTDRNNIYLVPGAFCASSIDGLALLAHEIVHCRQYREYGTWLFRALYLLAYFRNRSRRMSSLDAYMNIPFEIEARHVESEVRDREIRRRCETG